MKYNLNGLISIDKKGLCCFTDSLGHEGSKQYSLTLYLIGYTINQYETNGDISTIEHKTKNYIKVGEWAGIGDFIEMNIYKFGLYASSKFDPSQSYQTTKKKLHHLEYRDFENYEIPKNTQMHRYLKTVDRFIELAKYR